MYLGQSQGTEGIANLAVNHLGKEDQRLDDRSGFSTRMGRSGQLAVETKNIM